MHPLLYQMKKVNNIDELYFKNVKTYKSKKISYLNVSASFDIEVTSFYQDKRKFATMYLFGLGVNGRCILGRTYDDLISYINKLVELYDLNVNRRMIIYVHNLSYEFQFIRKHFEIDNVFAVDERKPVYVTLKNGIEFRCSYILSGYKLDTLGKHLNKYKVNKLSGEEFDYNKIRHSKTPLTDYEIEYILHDNYVVMSYIQELIEELRGINHIPLTKTSFVRKLLKDKCLYDGDTSHRRNNYKYIEYRDFISNLNIQSVSEYNQLKRAFQGGFTHASNLKVGNIYENVASNDFTSSYPYVLLSEYYPISSGRLVKIKNKEDFEKYLDCYCCIFDITFYNLEDKFHYEHYLSSSKCDIEGDYYNDNGRVVFADRLSTTITNVDYEIIKYCYKWKKLEISNFRIYEKGYLPKPIIMTILELYKTKTELKGVEGSEVEYMRSKENINSVYGCMVTDIAKGDIKYNDGWCDILPLSNTEIREKLKEYNDKKNRVLFYAWGVFVTAYARFNLWTGIFAYKEDYIYSDTDSIKGLNYEKHINYHNKYNQLVEEKLNEMCDFYKIDKELLKPKTIKGKVKMIGLWDYEGTYKKFKTLGAKRYAYIIDEGLSFTISGVNKNNAIPYLINGWSSDIKTHNENFNPLNKVTDQMYIPEDYTGKLTHTYIDDAFELELTDYLGNKCEVSELSYIHLSKQDFTLSMSASFIEYLNTFRLDLIL